MNPPSPWSPYSGQSACPHSQSMLKRTKRKRKDSKEEGGVPRIYSFKYPQKVQKQNPQGLPLQCITVCKALHAHYLALILITTF